MGSAAYYDFFRKIQLEPDGTTIEADSTTDTVTITRGTGVAFNANASNDSFEIDVDYTLYVPLGTTDIRLTDVNANDQSITLSAGNNIGITRVSDTEVIINATVGGASKAISNATQASPVVITTSAAHAFTEGRPVTITDVGGMTELNGNEYYMDILTSTTFALYQDDALTTPVNGLAFTPYTTGGVATAEYFPRTQLSELSDVDTTGVTINQILAYDGVAEFVPTSTFIGSVTGNVTGDLTGNVTGNLTGNTSGTHTGSVVGTITGNVVGDVTGSVFGDDSTPLVDSVANLIRGDLASTQWTTDSYTNIDVNGFLEIEPLVFQLNAKANGYLQFNAGDGSEFTGGYVQITAGDGGTSAFGIGGYVRINAGDGSAGTFGNGGYVRIDAGDASATATSPAGYVQINAGNATGGNIFGGYIQITAGNSTGNSVGSYLQLTAGSAVDGVGGEVRIDGGTSVNGAGGDVTIEGGVSINGAKGSVIIDKAVIAGNLTGNVTGDINGSVFADNSTLLVDGVNGIIPAENLTGTATINVTGNLTGNVLGNLTGNAAGDHTGTFTGDLIIDGYSSEVIQSGLSGTTVALSLSLGSVGYVASPSGDITLNITNVPTTDDRVTSVSVILNQGATPYEITTVQIGGIGQTILWPDGIPPTGTVNGIDIFTFTLFRIGAAWSVTGNMAGYA